VKGRRKSDNFSFVRSVGLPGQLNRFGDHRRPRRLPGRQAAGDLDQVGDAVLMEDADSDRRPVATGAVYGDAAVAGHFGDALLQMIQRQVHAALDVPPFPFARGAHVKQERRFRGVHLLSGNQDAGAPGRPDEVRSIREGLHSVSQKTHHVIKADTAESQGSFLLAARFGDDHDRLGAIEDRAGPRGVLPAEADVDAASEMALGILSRIAHIENLRTLVTQAENLVKFDGFETLLKRCIEGGAFAGVRMAS
jgi:hypothetical protein